MHDALLTHSLTKKLHALRAELMEPDFKPTRMHDERVKELHQLMILTEPPRDLTQDNHLQDLFNETMAVYEQKSVVNRGGRQEPPTRRVSRAIEL